MKPKSFRLSDQCPDSPYFFTCFGSDDVRGTGAMKRGELPGNERRGERMIRERVHDPYKTRLKLPDPTVCPRCGAVFHK